MGAPTRKMLGALHAMLGQLGVTDRAEKMRTLSAVLYRKVESSKSLTFDEARICLDTLSELLRHESSREALDSMVAAAEQRMGVVKS